MPRWNGDYHAAAFAEPNLVKLISHRRNVPIQMKMFAGQDRFKYLDDKGLEIVADLVVSKGPKDGRA